MSLTNLPKERNKSSSDLTLKVFDQYYKPIADLNYDELTAMKGLFEKKGFEAVAAEATALTILTQAKKDGYNAMQIMDTLVGLDTIAISGLVAEILNYNRFKSSAIGVTQIYSPSEEVTRNILL